MTGVQCTPIIVVEDKKISSAIEFIETPLFEVQRKALITDEELRALQSDIIKQPDIGKLIVGTGGLRKVRVSGENTGKSGGYRAIYLLAFHDVIYLVSIYKKGKKDTLTKSEKNDLKKLTAILKNEVNT